MTTLGEKLSDEEVSFTDKLFTKDDMNVRVVL
jgi:hypothetical protein